MATGQATGSAVWPATNWRPSRRWGDQRRPSERPAGWWGDLLAGGELYLGGVTVAAEIARELGVSASYAQRTLRRVKRDLAAHQAISAAGAGRATIPEPERSDQATNEHREREAARSPDQPTTPDRDRERGEVER